MPYQYQEDLPRIARRWKDGSIGCFSWPVSETVLSTTLMSAYGQDVISENELRGWKDRIRRGVDATTGYIAETRNLTYKPGYIYLGKWCGGSYQRYGYYSFDGDLSQGLTSVCNLPSAPSSTADTEADNLALTLFMKYARNKQGAFRGSTFMAELRQTVKGIRNPARGIRDLLDTYRTNARKAARRARNGRSVPTTRDQFRELERSNPRASRAVQRALSDSWLELQYGVLPLVGDVEDAAHSAVRISRRKPRAPVRAFSNIKRAPTIVFASRSHHNITITWEVHTYQTVEVEFYGAVKLEVDEPILGAVEEWGFRTRDFLPAVWELMPYSFLVDYFTNVGEIVEAISFPRSDIAWVGRTIRNSMTRDSSRSTTRNTGPTYPANGSTVVWEYTPMSVIWTRKYLERTSYSHSLVPSFRWEIPGAKDWRKWLNMSALARSRTL